MRADLHAAVLLLGATAATSLPAQSVDSLLSADRELSTLGFISAVDHAAADVVLVYPGPPQDLGARANEFLVDKKLPNNFDLVLDPGYTFTNMYGLRWDAVQETAYPSTFLIDRQGVVFFSKIVKEH